MTDRPTGDVEGTHVPRRRRRCPRRWNKKRRTTFLEALAETCNVSEAARRAEMDRSSAYDLKNREPAFARSWRQALESAHGDLEWRLLEALQKGSIKTKLTLDPKAREPTHIWVEHEYKLTVALRLFLSHKPEVTAFRAAEAADREDAIVSARVMARMEKIRAKIWTDEAEEIWGDWPDGRKDGNGEAAA